MPIVVHSPHSGRPVKIRDQDIGRAVKDEEGRIFYAVLRSEGQGHYGARTRHGSPKEEQRYLEMIEKGAVALQSGTERSQEQVVVAMHDATGRRRRRPVVVLLVLFLLLLAAAAGYYVVVLGADPTQLPGLPGTPQTPAPQQPLHPGPGSPTDPAPEPRLEHTPGTPQTPEGSEAADAAANIPPTATPWHDHPAGLQYRITTPGAGAPAQAGDYIQLAYRAVSADGQIDTQVPRQEPARFVLGVGLCPQAGIDQAVAGMLPGEIRLCRLPQALARSRTPVMLEVELLSVQPGIRMQTRTPGTGEPVTAGRQVTLHFEAYLAPDLAWGGQALDQLAPLQSTRQLGDPLVVKLGAGRIIPGLEAGVLGMRPGETRLVTIPPYLAYGARGAASGLIPPDATLAYQVELLDVLP